MTNDKKVYFYYDEVVPIVKGRYGARPNQEANGQQMIDIEWLNDRGACVGHSFVPENQVFNTRVECLAFAAAHKSNRQIV